MQDCCHSSLLLVPFQSEPANQACCLNSSLTPTERATLYRWGRLCVPITNAGSRSTSKSTETSQEQMAMTMYPGAFCAFPKLGGRVEPAHTPAPQFKTYCASAMNTQLSNLKAVLILMEEPPCHIPSPEHPAGSRIMTLSRDSLPMCWLITWPWPNCI